MDSLAIIVVFFSILSLFFLLMVVRHWIFLLPGFIGMQKDELSKFDEVKISRITGISGMLFSGLLLIIFIFFWRSEYMITSIIIIGVLFIAFNIGIAFKTAVNEEWIRKE